MQTTVVLLLVVILAITTVKTAPTELKDSKIISAVRRTKRCVTFEEAHRPGRTCGIGSFCGISGCACAEGLYCLLVSCAWDPSKMCPKKH